MKRRLILALVLVLILVLVSAPALAAGAYNLSWSTVDGGGGTSTSPAYSLTGTIGQPDAGQLGDGSYELSGGFWPWVKSVFEVYLPLVTRN